MKINMLAQAFLPVVFLAFANLGLAIPTLGPKLVARQGYVANCTATYTIQPFDNCNKIVNDFGDIFTLADFYSWNPQVNSFCSNLFPDQIVCVGVGNPTGAPPSCPVPVKPGVISNCDDCYKVVEGDSCQAILDANNITVAELLAWNPDLNSECSNLEIGYNYCVGVSESL
ncbi:hypothetical protein F5B17DRAFT_417968 [Nemania serpens]|nr:hypothetical protein F5B17DRAFT_417968 [Nemania serpens]